MKRILVVDDEAISAMTLERCLSDEGFEVLSAFSGSSAVETGLSFNPHLLISDWRLKDEIDGIKLAHLLQRRNDQLLTILYSGLSMEDAHNELRGINLVRIMAKPCDLDLMLGVVRETCGSP